MASATENIFREELLDRRGRLERAVDRAPADRHLAELLSEVDAALGRIDAGTYGFCETCHDTLERERLLADPLLRYCVDHLSPAERRALQQDLDLAAEIQRGLLPRPDLKTPGWNVWYHFAPLGPVSGDYCDVVVPDGTGEDTHFLLGDVSGKGVAASILMSNLHATFRTLVATGLPVDALMARANRLFCESTIASQYATMICVKASPAGDIQVANAGHCPALVRSGGRICSLQSGGLPLGMFCGSSYPVEPLHLDPGDTMLLYTDGLIESRNEEDAEYGTDRLLAMFEGLDEGVVADPRQMTDACLAHLASFAGRRSRHDDLTIMAIGRAQVSP